MDYGSGPGGEEAALKAVGRKTCGFESCRFRHFLMDDWLLLFKCRLVYPLKHFVFLFTSVHVIAELIISCTVSILCRYDYFVLYVGRSTRPHIII